MLRGAVAMPSGKRDPVVRPIPLSRRAQMILAIDAGNTRIKWGLWDRRWVRQQSVNTDDIASLGDVWAGLPTPLRVVACNVAGPKPRDWLDAWAEQRGQTVYWVESRTEQCGVRNGYSDPAQLGPDRWAALVAARGLARGAALVVNAGTAVTVDALTRDGEFVGGLILPGLALMTESLARGTARLPHARGCFELFPRSTADAITSGATQAVCGAVERMYRALAARELEPEILLGGGAAELLAPHIDLPLRLVPNLVLEGLRVIAQEEQAA